MASNMGMGSLVGKLLFSSALFFFFLAFVFVIVGYATFWLVPREVFTQGTNQVDGVGLKQACFTNFKFTFGHDPSGFELNNCVDNSRDSPTFARIKNVDVWSPRWFQIIQDMHLGCIIMMVFNLLLLAGFIAIYVFASYLESKGKRLSPCLILARCGLALWFILTIIIGILLIVEPLMFYNNYSSQSSTFYFSDTHSYRFGPGFGMTIGAGLCLLLSGGLGTAIFCGLARNVIKTTLNPQSQDVDYYSQDGSQYSASEADGLSISAEHRVRKDPDGLDESEVIENYQREPSLHADRKSMTSLSRGEKDEPNLSSPDGKPVAAPRRSMSSKDTSREPSIARQSYPSQSPPQYGDIELDRSPSQYGGSQAPSVRSGRPRQFVYDLKPGQGYVPKSSARPVSDVDSQYSAGNQRVSMSPHAPPTAGGRLYVPPSRSSYAGSAAGFSDTESHQSDRNRTVSKSSMARQMSEPPQPTQPVKVVKPKAKSDAKHSRYSASGW